jgi:hypothetical protein
MLSVIKLQSNTERTGIIADDTVILASHDDPVLASQTLQGHLDQLEHWLKK